MNARTAPRLQVSWEGRTLTATADRAPIVIGRSPQADVQVADPAVSREHLVVVIEDDQWVAVDRSSRGTYGADGRRVERIVIDPEATPLHLATPDGPGVSLVAVGAEVVALPPPIVAPIDPGLAGTVITSDPTLRLEVDGRTQRVHRAPACGCRTRSRLRRHMRQPARLTAARHVHGRRQWVVDGGSRFEPGNVRGRAARAGARASKAPSSSCSVTRRPGNASTSSRPVSTGDRAVGYRSSRWPSPR